MRRAATTHRVVATGRHPQFHTLGPHRIVGIPYVYAGRGRGHGIDGQIWRRFHHLRGRAADHSVHDNGLESQLTDRKIELGQRLFRRVHGDERHGGEPIGNLFEHVDVQHIHGPVDDRSQLIVFEPQHGQRMRAVDHGKIDPRLIEPRPHQFGQHGRGPVNRRRPRIAHPHRISVAPGCVAPHHLFVARRDLGPADLFDKIENRKRRLDHMAIRIDHRVVEFGPNIRSGDAALMMTGHVAPPLPYTCLSSPAA